MIKRMLIMLAVVGVVLGGVFGFMAFKGVMIKKYMASMGSPPQTVSTITAREEEWQPTLTAVGSLRAAKGVDISNEVAGIVESIEFRSGQDVREGQLLVRLRADDDIAKWRALVATANLARITLERDKKQLQAQAVSRAVVDTDAGNLASAVAQANAQKATAEKKFIHAPFAGRLGIRNVDLGQYLNPGTAIVTLQQLDPVYLDFYLPQQSLSALRVGQAAMLTTDAFPGQSFAARIAAVNPRVDPATRNLSVRAELPNRGRRLLPGMYASVSVTSGAPERHVTLPQTAITYNPYGNTVFLVHEAPPDKDAKPARDAKKDGPARPKLIAEQSFVTLGQTRGDQVAVLKGVKAGDVVVTSGQIKLQNGSTVLVDNHALPANDAAPKTPDQ